MQVTTKRSAIIKALIAISAALLFLNLTGLFLWFELGYPNLKGLIPIFNFDQEGNIPTYFSSLLLLLSSCLLYWISLVEKKMAGRFASQWTLLSIIFFLLSIDEAASIHELFVGPLRQAFNLSGIFYYSWVIVGVFVVIFLGGFFVRLVFALPQKTRRLFILGGALYVGAVIAMEMIGGYLVEIHTAVNLGYQLIVTVEETMEISGLIIFINALLMLLHDRSPALQIDLAP